MLKDTLPVAETVNAASVRNHLHGIAERAEAAPLGSEQLSFIDGCPAVWAALPRPPAPLTVGIDGCYVRQWDDKKTHFEVIVGKSMSENGPSRCFGYTQTYDEKPKRRLFELLRSQGMQMNTYGRAQSKCAGSSGQEKRFCQTCPTQCCRRLTCSE